MSTTAGVVMLIASYAGAFVFGAATADEGLSNKEFAAYAGGSLLVAVLCAAAGQLLVR